MRRVYYLIYVLLGVLSTHVYAEDTITIEKIYKNKLAVYSSGGKHQGFISSDKVALGTPVLEVTESGLAKILLDDRELWLRISALKLSRPVTGPCLTQHASIADDETLPAVSGLGVICEK